MKVKDKIAIAIGGGIALAASLIYALRTRAEDPDKAILFGQVIDSVTTEPIKDINVNCNGYTGKTNSTGDYRIINIEPGTYSVTFTDPLGRYEPHTE